VIKVGSFTAFLQVKAMNGCQHLEQSGETTEHQTAAASPISTWRPFLSVRASGSLSITVSTLSIGRQRTPSQTQQSAGHSIFAVFEVGFRKQAELRMVVCLSTRFVRCFSFFLKLRLK
jgi:hypothetical protein